MIVLHEARMVKFAGFVSPGHTLKISVEQIKREDSLVQLKFQGEVEGRVCVSGKLTLECFNLADDDPEQAGLDARMIAHQRSTESLVMRGFPAAAAAE